MNIHGVAGTKPGLMDDASVSVRKLPENPPQSAEKTRFTLEKENKQYDEEQVHNTIAELNKSMVQLGTRVTFTTDKDSGRLVIKVIENDSDKVIKQIPPEEMLRFFAHMVELVGMLVDKRA